MSENETPLVSLERDIAAYKTEVDETLKSYAKITLRSSNNDKSAYRKALEDGVAQLEEYKLEGSNMIIELNELKRDEALVPNIPPHICLFPVFFPRAPRRQTLTV